MSTGVTTQSVAGGGRICFRGDDRAPYEIFRAGFSSREAGEIKYSGTNPAPLLIHKEHARDYQQAGFKTVVGKTFDPKGMNPKEIYQRTLAGKSPKGMQLAIVPRTGDIRSESAVCVTPRFAMAVLFPPKSRPSDKKEFTWVYAVYVRELYNTHAKQFTEGMKAIEGELVGRDKASNTALGPYGGSGVREAFVDSVALWPLYAHELATKRILAGDVICAMRVKRSWNGPDFTHGCDYELLKRTLKFNRRCTVSKADRKAVKEFLKQEPVRATSPSRSSGFHKDDVNTRVSVGATRLAAHVDRVMQGRPQLDSSDSDFSDVDWE